VNVIIGFRTHNLTDRAKSEKHRNPFAAGQRTAPIWLDTRQVRSRQCSFCRARQHGIDFARQSNEHCLARQPRTVDTQLYVLSIYLCLSISVAFLAGYSTCMSWDQCSYGGVNLHDRVMTVPTYSACKTWDKSSGGMTSDYISVTKTRGVKRHILNVSIIQSSVRQTFRWRRPAYNCPGLQPLNFSTFSNRRPLPQIMSHSLIKQNID
jgi:hypothetical protein